MELHWCAMPGGNFGDDLNLVLWPTLFPDFASHLHDAQLYGIGTLLGGRYDRKTYKLVLGSGRGDAGAPIDQGLWDFRWVRGPMTARTLGLPLDKALGDGAWLWDGLAAPLQPSFRVGLVPHWATWDSFDWPLVASLAGMHAVNPRQHPSAVVNELRRCSLVLTESLHGAIFADAMGIPWAACRLSYRFNAFKWRDWLQSIGRPFEPHDAPVALAATLSEHKAVLNRLARWTDFRGASRYNPLRPVAASGLGDAWRVADDLDRFSRDTARFGCSAPTFVARQKERMLDACAAFAKDYGLAFQPPGTGASTTKTVCAAPAAMRVRGRIVRNRQHA